MSRILITVSGGVAEVDQSTIPEGIEVEIRDYDYGYGCGDLVKEDAFGKYEETLWSQVT